MRAPPTRVRIRWVWIVVVVLLTWTVLISVLSKQQADAQGATVIGNDTSLSGGLLGAAVLVAVNSGVVRLANRHPAAGAAVRGQRDHPDRRWASADPGDPPARAARRRRLRRAASPGRQRRDRGQTCHDRPWKSAGGRPRRRPPATSPAPICARPTPTCSSTSAPSSSPKSTSSSSDSALPSTTTAAGSDLSCLSWLAAQPARGCPGGLSAIQPAERAPEAGLHRPRTTDVPTDRAVAGRLALSSGLNGHFGGAVDHRPTDGVAP